MTKIKQIKIIKSHKLMIVAGFIIMATAVLQEHQRTPRRRSAYTFHAATSTHSESGKTLSGQLTTGLRSTRRRQINSQVEEPNNNNNNNNNHAKAESDRGKKGQCKEQQTSRCIIYLHSY